LEKDELVQALGLSFTVSTIPLAVNVALEGELRLSIASGTIAGLALACARMWIGQAIRLRMSPTTFRKWFFTGLMALSGCTLCPLTPTDAGKTYAPKADIHNEYTPYFAVATAPSGATSRYPTPSSVNRIRGWVGSTSIFCRNLRTKIRR
jgi:hypothetical protein